MKVLRDAQISLFCLALGAVAAPQYHPHLNPWPRPVNEKLPPTTTPTPTPSTTAEVTPDVPRPVITLAPFQSNAKPTDAPKETTVFLEYKSDGDVKTADGEEWMEKYEAVFNKLKQSNSKDDAPVDNVKRLFLSEPQPEIPEDLPEKMAGLTYEQVQRVEQFLLPLFSKQFTLPWFRGIEPDTLRDCMDNIYAFKLDKTDPQKMLTYINSCAMMNFFERNKSEPIPDGVAKRDIKVRSKPMKGMVGIGDAIWNVMKGEGVKANAEDETFLQERKLADEMMKKEAMMELAPRVSARGDNEGEKKEYVGVNINSTVPGADIWNWFFHGVPLVHKEQWDPTWKTGIINYPTPEEQKKAADEYDRQQAENKAKKLAKLAAEKAKEDEEVDKQVDEIIKLADQEAKDAAEKDASKFQKRGLWDDRSVEEQESHTKRCLLPEELEQLKKESADRKKIQARGCLDADLVNQERGLWDDRSIPVRLSEDGVVDERGLWDRVINKRGLWDDRSVEEGIEERGLWDDRAVDERGLWDDRSVEERGLWDDRSVDERGLWDDRSVEDNESADEENETRGISGIDLLQKGTPSPFPTFAALVEFIKAIEKADNKTIDAIDAELSDEDAQKLSMLLLSTFAKSTFENVSLTKPKAEAPAPEVEKPEPEVEQPKPKAEEPKPEIEEPKIEEPKPKAD
ncbi:hypothetical protein LIA77_06681 [Sarocladium implicatum]|nr:hypothetical protein LIA77_06681 [Sarocladium implicatum]